MSITEQTTRYTYDLGMDRAEITAIGAALFGLPGWQSPIAKAIGVDTKTVKRWIKNDAVPDWAAQIVRAMRLVPPPPADLESHPDVSLAACEALRPGIAHVVDQALQVGWDLFDIAQGLLVLADAYDDLATDQLHHLQNGRPDMTTQAQPKTVTYTVSPFPLPIDPSVRPPVNVLTYREGCPDEANEEDGVEMEGSVEVTLDDGTARIPATRFEDGTIVTAELLYVEWDRNVALHQGWIEVAPDGTQTIHVWVAEGEEPRTATSVWMNFIPDPLVVHVPYGQPYPGDTHQVRPYDWSAVVHHAYNDETPISWMVTYGLIPADLFPDAGKDETLDDLSKRHGTEAYRMMRRDRTNAWKLAPRATAH